MEILKLGMRPVRMRVRNVVNVALLPGWGKVSVPFSLVSVSSCMTGIIRLVFLNEARCLSSLSSSPLLPASPPHPQRRMEQTLTLLELQMPGCVQLCVLSVLGRPVLHYKLIVLLSLNHSTRRQEECYHTAVEHFHVSFLYLLFIVSFIPSYSFSISNKPIRIQSSKILSSEARQEVIQWGTMCRFHVRMCVLLLGILMDLKWNI